MIIQRSLGIGWLVLRGCFLALSASLTLPHSFAAAQSTPESVSSINKLFRSVQANDFAGVRSAVSEGADVQARDRWGMTPTDIAIDRGYYRIAHFLAAARHLNRDHDTASSASPVAAKTAPLRISETRANAPAQIASNRSAEFDSLPADDEADSVSLWPAGEANPFDPATPAPGSQLRSMQAR